MKIDCIAIEDEPLALKKITDFINQLDYLNFLGGFDNALDASAFLKNQEVDLIFLDIQMKKLNGIQFLESLRDKPKVIITSAYDTYALKGYELDVSDYLLKPFTFDRFIKSVEKVFGELRIVKGKQKKDFIFIKTEHRLEKVDLDDILFIQGMKDYLLIHCTHKRIMTLQTFKNMVKLLPQGKFMRVHNSYLVAVSKIKSIERNRISLADQMIPISDSYREAFYDFLNKEKII